MTINRVKILHEVRESKLEEVLRKYTVQEWSVLYIGRDPSFADEPRWCIIVVQYAGQ